MEILLSSHGGYLAVSSIRYPLVRTAFLWLNISKEYLPWYCPNPLSPTPPNGSESIPYCTTASLNVTLPDDVSSTIRRLSAAFLVNA
ncbi:Os04g0540750 [Oryza sativa Japonica Group]|uniref:Os04g0540750 protein n=1 Tax=Oryza sativa subsp. japonica TaxID=39947 RepID=A0A0P0WCW3_ORYSJ|nr:hypothetical protein EE612_024671 [Oryza sativa]BAS90292.1 Os04g0540750 [Oryza sativa Japonica Group]